MKQISLSGSLREDVGRQNANELRRSGRVPGVLYGGETRVHFSVDSMDLSKIMRQPETFQINLEVAGKVYHTVIQETQAHPVSDKIVHIDLLELIPGKEIKTALPVRVTGSSEGVKAGGKLVQNYRKMRIIGKPEDLPEAIVVDISPLQIGDLIRVREVGVPGCRFAEAEASAVVAVQATRASIAANQASEDDGKKKKK
ncbi:MAG: 50S ribosomal protein L25 [Flavobacteriales bacterium]|jgi:large subunit ribosomal protein L25